MLTVIHVCTWLSTKLTVMVEQCNVGKHNLCMFFTLLITCSLALVDGGSLVIGSVDQIQMLHIETIPLGESVR